MPSGKKRLRVLWIGWNRFLFPILFVVPPRTNQDIAMNEEKRENLANAVKAGLDYCRKESERLVITYVSEAVVPPLKAVLKDVVKEIQENHMFRDNEGNFVIHYTSIAVLLDMIQSYSKDEEDSSLRLYDSVHFNDPDEGKYLERNLKKQFSWLQDQNVLEGQRRSHAYIASFIIPDAQRDMSNNLVFWRTYGHEGEGCSLLLYIPFCRLRKVIYGPDGTEQTGCILRAVLDMLKPLVNIERHQREIRSRLSAVIWQSLEEVRYLYKSEAYDYEKECRFVIPESDICKDKIYFEYQERNNYPGIVRHYCENEIFKINSMLVSGSSITLGPRVSDADNVRYCLEILLKRKKLLVPTIKISEISYRKF